MKLCVCVQKMKSSLGSEKSRNHLIMRWTQVKEDYRINTVGGSNALIGIEVRGDDK